jgi:tetraacyldisaccharide 4'-kinase
MFARPLFGMLGLGLEKAYFSGGTLRRAFIRPKRVDARVLSVGNLVFGGSGKTPLVGFLARVLKKRGEAVGVVLKGYKGKRNRDPLIVSDGKNILASVAESGDEAFALALSLPGVPVVVGKNRLQAALVLTERFLPGWVLLDDGFSQPYLAKDLELVLLTGEEFNRRLAGIGLKSLLREPIGALKRANALIVPEGLPSEVQEAIEAFVANEGVAAPTLRLVRSPRTLLDLVTGKELPLDAVEGKRIVGLAGIARPERFFSLLDGLYGPIAGRLAFEDHAPYTTKRVRGLMEAVKGASVVCTFKDYVKLVEFRASFSEKDVLALMEDVRLEPGETLERLLFGRGE